MCFASTWLVLPNLMVHGLEMQLNANSPDCKALMSAISFFNALLRLFGRSPSQGYAHIVGSKSFFWMLLSLMPRKAFLTGGDLSTIADKL